MNTGTIKNKISSPIIVIIVALSVLPFLLDILGIDFGIIDQYRGNFVHVLWEWSSFCLAVIIVILSLIHFYITDNVITPIICMAFFYSGCIDAYHILTANGIIHTAADLNRIISFSGMISRLLGAIIIIFGVSLLLFKNMSLNTKNIHLIIELNIYFAVTVFVILYLTTTVEHLPQTMYKDSIVTRPYDLAALVLYILAGIFLYPKFYKKFPSIFSHAIIISLIPQIVNQLHMSFGSSSLYDSHYFIAHFSKFVAYSVPFIGLILEYINTYKEKVYLISEVIIEKTLKEEKEKLLIQQSKMAAMGEMIGAIAHQWKQPLNALSLMVQDLPDAFKYKEIDQKYIDELVKDAMKQIHYMSETITDFKSFFEPNKEKALFNINNAITVVVNIISSQFKKLSINVTVNKDIEDNFTIKGFQNEFMQVVLNIVNNAKDAIVEARQKGLLGNEEGKILINIYRKNSLIVTEISDNAGGIPLKIIDKIFESYFTTKDTSKGTGIGLYMARIIIEEKMGGSIYAKNTEDGAMFLIELNHG